MTKTEQEKHEAGGPGKSGRKGHIDDNPESRVNKPGQRQSDQAHGPDKGSSHAPNTERGERPL